MLVDEKGIGRPFFLACRCGDEVGGLNSEKGKHRSVREPMSARGRAKTLFGRMNLRVSGWQIKSLGPELQSLRNVSQAMSHDRHLFRYKYGRASHSQDSTSKTSILGKSFNTPPLYPIYIQPTQHQISIVSPKIYSTIHFSTSSLN